MKPRLLRMAGASLGLGLDHEAAYPPDIGPVGADARVVRATSGRVRRVRHGRCPALETCETLALCWMTHCISPFD